MAFVANFVFNFGATVNSSWSVLACAAVSCAFRIEYPFVVRVRAIVPKPSLGEHVKFITVKENVQG
jgi:hypothetical protein